MSSGRTSFRAGSALLLRRQGAQAELGELGGVDGGGRAGERVGARLRLRERDHLADVVLAAQDRGQPVDAEREAGVRRRAVAERVEQEPEARLRLRRR